MRLGNPSRKWRCQTGLRKRSRKQCVSLQQKRSCESLDTFERDEREAREEQVKQETTEHFAEQFPDSAGDIGDVLYAMTKEVLRSKIMNDGVRPDGRRI